MVEISGIRYNSGGNGQQGHNYTVQLDNTAYGKGANSNYVHQCPLGTTKTTRIGLAALRAPYSWVFLSNGGQVNFCTLPK